LRCVLAACVLVGAVRAQDVLTGTDWSYGVNRRLDRVTPCAHAG